MRYFKCWFVLMFVSSPAIAQTRTQSPEPKQMFERLDKNGDGQISRDEAPRRLNEMFDEFDNDRDGQVSLAEMQKNFSKARSGSNRNNSRRRPGEVVTPPALEERIADRLKAGDLAPSFSLPTVQGDRQVELRELIADKPAVLVFGSISCSPFRQRVEQVERLYQQYHHKANFVMIYIREAHPDSIVMVKQADGAEKLQKFTQTDNAKLRDEHARSCSLTLGLSFPMLVDTVDNSTNTAYAGWPIRIVTIGVDGKIVDPGAQGPQGFQPEKLEDWLKK